MNNTFGHARDGNEPLSLKVKKNLIEKIKIFITYATKY